MHLFHIVRSLSQDLRQKNWKAMEALNQAEQSAGDTHKIRDQLNSKDSQIARLKSQLEAKSQQMNVREFSLWHNFSYFFLYEGSLFFCLTLW